MFRSAGSRGWPPPRSPGRWALLAGLGYRPLGIAAAIGVVLYFLGAVLTHLRARDVKGLPAPVSLLAVAVGALVLGVLSA